jgi:integrase
MQSAQSWNRIVIGGNDRRPARRRFDRLAGFARLDVLEPSRLGAQHGEREGAAFDAVLGWLDAVLVQALRQFAGQFGKPLPHHCAWRTLGIGDPLFDHRRRAIEFVFPSRLDHSNHISTRQYARLVDEWVTGIGLRPEDYGTHSLRRTKASIIYKQTGNLRAVQILLGHAKIESTVRYLGVDVEDALTLAEGTEV